MYNIKMVAKLLDLSPMTIRAWETRYQIVNPIRSEGGHRLYSDEDLRDLRWLLVQTREKGLSISHAAQMLQKKKAELLAPSIHNQNNGMSSNYASLQNDLYQALMNVDIEQADRLVNLGFSMYQLEEMLHKVLVPLMIRVGDEWEQGVISVAQEHMVSEFVKQRCMEFSRLFHKNPMLPTVIALCPAGERHELGLLLFSLFLRRKGLDVIYLGADTPVEGVVEIFNRRDVDWICLSLTDTNKLEDVTKYIEYLLQLRPQLKLVLGGKGFATLDQQHPYWSYVIGEDIEQWEHWYQRS